mgnify:CR=1 FL=1
MSDPAPSPDDRPMRSSRTVPFAVAIVAAFASVSCGAAAEKASEKATEKMIESQTGGNVDVDTDGEGKVDIEDDSGTGNVSARAYLSGLPSMNGFKSFRGAQSENFTVAVDQGPAPTQCGGETTLNLLVDMTARSGRGEFSEIAIQRGAGASGAATAWVNGYLSSFSSWQYARDAFAKWAALTARRLALLRAS